ncbi:MAG: thiosulfate oxidation carrier complex protein SoxZ [Alphaproteobacteria bacterium]|nr:thiosulfate oxidation carrier complex protein SoxZ [Alphaproteobacteria bacterium]
MAATPRVKLPETIKAGETIEVRALVRHPMERGHRKDAQGRTIQRNIIHTFTAELDGHQVFRAKFGTGVAANPFLSFYVTVAKPGTLALTWVDDNGVAIQTERALDVVA